MTIPAPHLFAGAPKPLHVLVVDDERLVRRVVSRVLQVAGHTVIEASSGEEALEQLVSDAAVRLLVTDVGLPGILGPELIRRAELLSPGLPTVLMSGTPRPSLIADGTIRADEELLEKPFSARDLLARVRIAVARCRSGVSGTHLVPALSDADRWPRRRVPRGCAKCRLRHGV